MLLCKMHVQPRPPALASFSERNWCSDLLTSLFRPPMPADADGMYFKNRLKIINNHACPWWYKIKLRNWFPKVFSCVCSQIFLADWTHRGNQQTPSVLPDLWKKLSLQRHEESCNWKCFPPLISLYLSKNIPGKQTCAPLQSTDSWTASSCSNLSSNVYIYKSTFLTLYATV